MSDLLLDIEKEVINPGGIWDKAQGQGIGVLEAVAKAQLALVYEWGNEPCPHAGYVGDDALLSKRECSVCWQALKQQGG